MIIRHRSSFIARLVMLLPLGLCSIEAVRVGTDIESFVAISWRSK